MSRLVNDLVDLLNQNGKCRDAICQVVQCRIVPPFRLQRLNLSCRRIEENILSVGHSIVITRRLSLRDVVTTIQEPHQILNCSQRSLEIEQFSLFQPSAFKSHSSHTVTRVEEIRQREIGLGTGYSSHLTNLLHPPVHPIGIRRKLQRVDQTLSKGRETLCFQLCSDLIEAYFPLKIIWVYHIRIIYSVCSPRPVALRGHGHRAFAKLLEILVKNVRWC